MKIVLRVLLAALCIFLGLKFLLPHNAYPIEHFEQFLASFLPFSWKVLSVLSRILVGLFFIMAFLFLFYWEKIKWTKYLSIFMISIPFIINPVFPENFKDNTPEYDENLSFELENSSDETLLIYVSPKCLHCKEALIKLDKANKKSTKFKEVIVISYNNKIQEFLNKNQLDLSLQIISAKLFVEMTKGSFPKFQFVKNNKISKKWSNASFNYAVLDNLSQ